MKKVSAFKMKGFSGFGDGTGVSPVKAADEGLIEASKMGSEEAAETTRQMGENISDMFSEAIKNRKGKEEEDDDSSSNNNNNTEQ
tara:strand:- start:228 stop:482 length:255 start_codon:yes stop_codon:yes gene_type:complete